MAIASGRRGQFPAKLTGLVRAWSEFLEDGTRIKVSIDQVGLFHPLPWYEFRADWVTCRHGDLAAARSGVVGKNGAPFVPL